MTAEAVAALQGEIGGTVSVPGEPGYDEAVNIWNGAIARSPAAVASCTSSSDIVAALAFAKREGLEAVTHSLYIQDPDGNEIELYIDVQPEVWQDDPAAVFAPTKPLRL